MKKNIILLLLIVVFGAVCFYLGNTFDFSKNKGDYYIEQGYSFKVPSNWTETDELGTTAFLNEEEDNGDNPFKSYIFFVKDDLLGRSPSQYFEYIKGNIKTEIIDDLGIVYFLKPESLLQGRYPSIVSAINKSFSESCREAVGRRNSVITNNHTLFKNGDSNGTIRTATT